MREIKFRVYDKNKQKYIEGGTRNICGIIEGVTVIEVSDDQVLEQFTGLKDSQGVDVYEGDILYYVPGESDINNRIIKYIGGGFIAEVITTGLSKTLTKYNLKSFKVVGTIHEKENHND